MTSSFNIESHHVEEGTSLLVNIQVVLKIIIDVEPRLAFVFSRCPLTTSPSLVSQAHVGPSRVIYLIHRNHRPTTNCMQVGCRPMDLNI